MDGGSAATVVGRTGPHAAWAIATALVAIDVASVAARASEGTLLRGDVAGLALLVLALAGALVVNQQPANPVGWLLLVAGVAAVAAAQVRDDRLAAVPGARPSAVIALISDATWPLGLPLLAAALLLVFPDPRTPPRWPVPLAAGLAGVVLLELGVLASTWSGADHPGLANPLPDDARLAGIASVAGRVLVLGAAVAGIVRLVHLHRRGDAATRAQVRALLGVAAAALAAVAVGAGIAVLADSPAWLDESLPVPVVIGFPAAVAFAAGRHRLFGFRVVVHRGALATIALLATFAAAFAAAAALAGALAPAPARPFLSGAAAAFVAACLALAARQAVAARLRPPGAAAVLGRLPTLAEPGEALEEWAAVIRETLVAPAVELRVGGQVARCGDLSGLPVVCAPLRADGPAADELVVAWRSPAEPYDRAAERTIAGLAHLVGGAVERVRMAEEARRARRALAGSIAAERERLRRDVHDQLGPRLAGIAYLLAAVPADAPGAEHLARARAELGAAVEDARRIAHDLAPRPVEELGLVEAVRQHAERWSRASGIAVELALDPSLDVGGAPATAIYAVALEAMANAERHSRASTCRVALGRTPGGVLLAVDDDGVGIGPDSRPGVGLASMRERAEALAGALAIEQRGGTGIRFEVPLDG